MTEDQAKYNWSSTNDQKKQCRHCGITTTTADAGEHFYRSNNSKDGFESTCKKCKVRLATERRLVKKQKPVRKTAPASVKEKTDTIHKNNHPVDLDEMVKQLLEQAGHPGLYGALEKQAHSQFRTPALQAVAIISGSV